MKTVIGLFSNDKNVQRSIDKMQEVGIARGEIRVLASEDTVADLLNGHPAVILAKYVGWGVIISMSVFGLYELIGRICDCGLPLYGFRVELDTLVLFIVVGALLSVLVGYFVGVEKLEGNIRFYTWNAQRGHKVVAVRTNDELEDTVINILHKANGVAIKTLECRLRSFWSNRHSHSPYRY
jgi:hypothetical protein